MISSILSVRTERPLAALTFDDGPDEFHTPRILDVLARRDARATFFVLAKRAERFPDIVTAIRNGGHEIGLHGDDHSPVVHCSTRDKIRRIHTGKRRVEGLIGNPVTFYRPPYGWQDARAFLVARLTGMEVIGWSADGGDWLDLTPKEVADRATTGIARGSIVLLHDRAEPVPNREGNQPAAGLDRAEVVEQVLDRAAELGIGLVSLGELLRAGSAERSLWFDRPDDLQAAFQRAD
jgi:peptidoglycan/xylan/chitin deacetylase (PgdA/CDA1 family)